METLTEERLLISEDKNGINAFRANVEGTLEILNELNEVFPIESVEEIPGKVSEFIFEKAKERIPKLRADLKVYKNVSLSDYLLPDDLSILRAKLETWAGLRDKTGLQYIIRGENEFELNQEKIDAHCESFRTYIEGDQLHRMEMANEQCSMFNQLISNIHPMLITPNFKSPLCRLTASNVFEPNMNFVLTGDLWTTNFQI